MKNSRTCIARTLISTIFTLMFLLILGINCFAFNFPAAGWHRGDVTVAQEDSYASLSKALKSANPNIELDLIDFIDQNGNRVGLISHDYLMKRATGMEGTFSENYHDLTQLPRNQVNPKLPSEPFMTVIDLFELIKARKAQGVAPIVSLDMKEEGDKAEEFSLWVGKLVQKYSFQNHVFASSFFKSNSFSFKKGCPECMVGGLVFNDHFALKYLEYQYTSLDLTILSEITYAIGFWGKEEYNHDFVLIQDDIFFQHPELVDYWKNVRKVKFVGVFAHNKQRPYTKEEWELLKKVDWLELDPPQMKQYLQMKKISKR